MAVNHQHLKRMHLLPETINQLNDFDQCNADCSFKFICFNSLLNTYPIYTVD